MDRLTSWARMAGRHYVVVLIAAVVLTALSASQISRLRFNTDLADLLPADNPDLQNLRRIQAKYPSDTGLMVLLSKNFMFATNDQGQAMVHNGRKWLRTDTGHPLHAVWGFAVDDVYAAGAAGSIYRYDGKRWSPRPSGTDATLRGLWGASPARLFAVGDRGTILSRVDGHWRRIDAPTDADLRAVSGNANGAAYAVGVRGTALRRDAAGKWIKEPLPTAVDLEGVWVAQDGQAFAVGRQGTFLQRTTDGRWRAVPTGTKRDLFAIWGARAEMVMAVGAGGTALRFDGQRTHSEVFRIDDDMHALFGLSADRAWTGGDHCELERRTIPRVERRRGKMMEIVWWKGVLDTVEHVRGLLPDGLRPDPPACTATYTGIWRPATEMKRIAEFVPELAKKLAANPLVGRIEYKRPVKFFTDRALYFLSVDDLRSLHDELAKTLERETARRTGLFVDLDEEQDKSRAELGGQDRLAALFREYKRRIGQQGTSELYQHYDKASLGIIVYPQRGGSDLASLRRLHDSISATIAASGYQKVDPLLRIDIGGDGISKILEYDDTIADISSLGWLAVIGITLTLLLYTRRLTGLIFVLVPLAMSIAWTFALTALSIGTLNVVTGFLFAVLFGIGIDYGLQLYGRYVEDRQAGLSPEQATDNVVLKTGRATLTSAITSSGALLTLTMTDFRGFSEFGLISGVGILFALVAFLLVLPALIQLAERLGVLKIRPSATRRRRERPLRAPRLVLLASAAAVLFGIFGATRTEFEYNHRVLRPVGKANEIHSRSGHMTESYTPTLFSADTPEALRSGIDALERSRARLGEASAVRKTMSILQLVPTRQPEKRVLLRRIDALLHKKRWNLVDEATKKRIELQRLRTMAGAEPFTVRDLPLVIRRNFKGPGFGEAWLGMAYYGINISDTREARLLKKQVGTFHGSPIVSVGRLLPSGAKIHVEGSRVEVDCAGRTARCRDLLAGLRHQGKPVFSRVLSREEAERGGVAVAGALRGELLALARPGVVPVARRLAATITPGDVFHASSGELVLTEVVEVMLRDGRIAFVLSFTVVFLACLIDFRSLRLATLACLPLLVGMLGTFGTLYLLRIKLNMFNFVVLPALLGIGIDYGVHVVHRHQEEGADGIGRVRGALYWVLFFCAITSVCGFGNMALAGHPGLRSLGQLAIIGLAWLFVAAMYSLCAVLQLRSVKAAANEASIADPEGSLRASE